jgi:tRNA (cmo5U34)-methyltransferase
LENPVLRDAWKDESFAIKWDGADWLTTNPDRLNQLELLVALLRQAYRAGDQILDIGVGSGLVEELLFQSIPDAQVLGIDHSAAMLALASRRHADKTTQMAFRELGFAALDRQALPESPFRFVICVQALHEVSHREKQRLFAQVRNLISNDGKFYILDRFVYDHENFSDEYRATWQRLNQTAELGEPLDYDNYHARYSSKTDHVAGVDDYLKWLNEADFTAVCMYQQFNRALLCARPV